MTTMSCNVCGHGVRPCAKLITQIGATPGSAFLLRATPREQPRGVNYVDRN